VNLLDEESDEDVPPSPPKVSPVEGSKHPLQAVHEEIPPSVKDVDREEEKNAPAGGSDDDGGRDGSMGAPKESVLLAIDDEKAQEAEGISSHLIGARDRFSELGTPSISRRLAFQGPDIDPLSSICPSSRCCERDEGARGVAGTGASGDWDFSSRVEESACSPRGCGEF